MKKIKILLIIALSVFLTYAIFAKKSWKKFHSKHFEYLDKNKDGKISKDEWMAKFESIDSDKSDSITKEEMKKYHKVRKKKCKQ